VSSLSDAELVALHLGIDQLIDKSKSNPGGRILIASDSFSNLSALARGPLKQANDSRKDLWRKIMDLSRKSDEVIFMFVYGHTGIAKNEMVDMVAADTLRIVKTRQDDLPVSISGIKSLVQQHRRTEWLLTMPDGRHRQRICGTKKTLLAERDSWDRREQSEIARLRCGEHPEIGPYPRRIRGEKDNTCRWCGQDPETVYHCLNDCHRLRDLRRRLDVNTERLAKVRSRSEAHKILRFVEEAVQLITKKFDEKRNRVRKIDAVSDEVGSPGIKRARV